VIVEVGAVIVLVLANAVDVDVDVSPVIVLFGL